MRQALVTRIVKGPGRASVSARRAAFDCQADDSRTDALVARVAQQAWTVGDADVSQPVAAGVSEDHVFEVVVCAAVGQATRQLETALAALDQATFAAEQSS
jgi:hypothetical protein